MKRLAEYDTFAIPVEDIFYDESFNCRGSFTLPSVKELADSIEESGLQFPAVVQPHEGRYRLLAGHRRFKAVTAYLKWETFPAIIRHDLTEHQARILNLTENLERKDLNILEEANAINRLYSRRITIREIATELKRPQSWVTTRRALLKLTESVQKLAAAGLLSAADIKDLCKFDSRVQTQRANAMVRAKQGRKTRQVYRTTRLRKTKAEISQMLAILMEVGVEGLAPRLLSWAAGYTSDKEIKRDIREEYPKYRFRRSGPDSF
jgi:ParB family chromosome partitioning protein